MSLPLPNYQFADHFSLDNDIHRVLGPPLAPVCGLFPTQQPVRTQAGWRPVHAPLGPTVLTNTIPAIRMQSEF